MKILALSDRVEPLLYDHFSPENFSQIDLILSCGDLPPEYLTFLVTMFNVPLYYVKGNHDIRYASSPPKGCKDIDGRLIRFQGLNILGLEGSHWYNGGPMQYTQREMRKKVQKLRLKIWRNKGIDVVVTHAPPRHVKDAEDPCHMGFESFFQIIARYEPACFIHGHIHADFTNSTQRETVVGKTRVINCFGHQLIEMEDVKVSD